MKNTLKLGVFILGLMLLAPSLSWSQNTDDPKLQPSSVWVIEYIRTTDGSTGEYLDYLAKYYVTNLEAAKTEGRVKDYKIITSMPGNDDDWDVMIMIEHKDFAALEKAQANFAKWMEEREKTESKEDKEAREKAVGSRFELRTIIGGKLAREVTIKP